MSRDPSILIVTGPTASGKGALAFELARRLGGEIVSVDSMKVYRELDIVTAKPSAQRRAEVPHHLIDVVDPDQYFSVGRYLELLDSTLEDISRREKPAVLCGGTALYLKAYLDGLQSAPEADWTLRDRLEEEAAQHGPERLHARLLQVDPVTAAKIHPADTRRLVRALEVATRTGQSLSKEWSWGSSKSEPAARLFGVQWERQALYARVDQRVERMLEGGLFEESLRLQGRQPPLSRSAAQTVGYKEIVEGLAKGLPQSEIVALIQQNTRRMAKRQLTWFRKFPVEWIQPGDLANAVDQAQRVLALLDQGA